MSEPSDSPKSNGPDSPRPHSPLNPAKTHFSVAPPLKSSAAGESSGSGRSQGLAGLRNDLAEFGDSFKSSLSLLSSKNAVAEISRIASSLLQFGEDDDDLGSYVPGINGEVLDFVEEISAVPKNWTNFPLALENDFEMSPTQNKHAVAIEQLAPSLRNLRVELESSITQGQFWRIYFTMLLSRLDKDDFELLSTPKITEVRNAILQELQKIEHEKSKKSEDGTATTQGENSSSQVKVVGSEAPNAGKGKQTEDAVNNLNTGYTYSIVAGQRTLLHEDYFSAGLPSLGPMQEAGTSSSPGGPEDWVDLDVSQNPPKVIKPVSGEREPDWVEIPQEAASREGESGSDGSDDWTNTDFD